MVGGLGVVGAVQAVGSAFGMALRHALGRGPSGLERPKLQRTACSNCNVQRSIQYKAWGTPGVGIVFVGHDRLLEPRQAAPRLQRGGV